MRKLTLIEHCSSSIDQFQFHLLVNFLVLAVLSFLVPSKLSPGIANISNQS